MTHVYTPRHPPCVGGASKLHGHPQSQLHPPRSDPDIRHFETIFRDRAVREWAADDKGRSHLSTRTSARGRLRNGYGHRVVVELPSPAAGATAEAASAAAARVIRTARATDASVRRAATKNGSPGRVAGALGLMNQPKTSVHRIGPRTP